MYECIHSYIHFIQQVFSEGLSRSGQALAIQTRANQTQSLFRVLVIMRPDTPRCWVPRRRWPWGRLWARPGEAVSIPRARVRSRGRGGRTGVWTREPCGEPRVPRGSTRRDEAEAWRLGDGRRGVPGRLWGIGPTRERTSPRSCPSGREQHAGTGETTS